MVELQNDPDYEAWLDSLESLIGAEPPDDDVAAEEDADRYLESWERQAYVYDRR